MSNTSEEEQTRDDKGQYALSEQTGEKRLPGCLQDAHQKTDQDHETSDNRAWMSAIKEGQEAFKDYREVVDLLHLMGQYTQDQG